MASKERPEKTRMYSISAKNPANLIHAVLLQHPEATVLADGRELSAAQPDWCTKERLKGIITFTVSEGGTELIYFHDTPFELLAHGSLSEIVRTLSAQGKLHFKEVQIQSAPAGPNGRQPSKQRSSLGTKALIVAVCAFILAFVPFLILAVFHVKGADVLAWTYMVTPSIALVAIVMGTISLVRKDGRKAAAVGIAFALAAYVFGAKVSVWSCLEADKTICRSNLHVLSQTVRLHMDLNEDVPPPDLDTLIQVKLLGPDSLRCRSVRDSDRASDYFYLAPAKDIDGRSIIACDFKGNHRHGRYVLHYDSSATWMDDKDFAAELAKPQNAAFANSLRQAEKTQR